VPQRVTAAVNALFLNYAHLDRIFRRALVALVVYYDNWNAKTFDTNAYDKS